MTVHNFNNSQKTEKNTTAFHDLVYQHYKEYLQTKAPEATIDISVDRNCCDYNTPEGRKYQENDSDAVLKIIYKSKDGNKKGVRTASEKSRGKYFKDLLLEVVSVLHYDPQKPDMPAIHKKGWLLLPPATHYSPQLFSTIFHEPGKNQFKSILIANYPKLKEHLKNDLKIEELVESNKFKLLIKGMIKKAPERSSMVPCPPSFCPNIQFIVVAYNKNRGQPYYTVSLTFSVDFLKSVKDIYIHENKLAVPEKNNKIKFN